MNRRRYHLGFALALTLLAPIFAFGCSDKGDDAEATVTAVPKTQPATVTVNTSPTKNSTVAGVPAPDAKYTQYVAAVCSATAKFQKDLAPFASTSFAKKLIDNPDAAFSDVSAVFETYSSDLKKADAPPELDAWQTEVENRIDAAAQGLKNKDQSQLSKIFDSQLPDVPADAKDKLQQAAKNNNDCNSTHLFG